MTTEDFNSNSKLAALRRDPPSIMSVPEVSVYLGQSERKTRKDVRLGRLPAIKLGGRVLFMRKKVDEALEQLIAD